MHSLAQVAGFLPRDERYAEILAAAQAEVPVLLVHGLADALVPVSRSRDLQAAIEGNGKRAVQRHEHSGAHMVPSCSGEFKQLLQSFIDSHI